VIDVSGCSAVQRLYEVDDGIDGALFHQMGE